MLVALAITSTVKQQPLATPKLLLLPKTHPLRGGANLSPARLFVLLLQRTVNVIDNQTANTNM
jgi:hypothetical protein